MKTLLFQNSIALVPQLGNYMQHGVPGVGDGGKLWKGSLLKTMLKTIASAMDSRDIAHHHYHHGHDFDNTRYVAIRSQDISLWCKWQFHSHFWKKR